MRSFTAALLSSLFIGFATCASSPVASVRKSRDFTPPQVFKNTNLLRTVDITKPYVREVTAVIVENISRGPKSEYYVAFDKEDRVGYVEARDKSASEKQFEAARVEYDSQSKTQYYQILIDPPLAAGKQVTLQIATGLLDTIVPVPAEVAQMEKQYLVWSGTTLSRSAYATEKQKTKIKVPSSDVPEFTKLDPKSDGTEDPARSGRVFTYGPYDKSQPLEVGKPVSVRYEHTNPVIKMKKLERDIEVSHWGGNVAFEERYAMTNQGASLKGQFNRVHWAASNYNNRPTHAVKQLQFDLGAGASDPYYTDEIGNISTSRFRSTLRNAPLELKPRFPIFGGWNASFVIGWNHNLGKYLKVKPGGEDFVLRVPFIEGPKEPTQYDRVEVTVILPEGATNVKYDVPIPIQGEERYLHKTFMDTLGRTALKLSIDNFADEQQHRDITVTYHLSRSAVLRKPFVIFTALSTVFMFSWLVSKVDTRIK